MRRILKIFAWAAGLLMVLVVTLTTAVFVITNTDGGRAFIERLTYRLTSGHVKLVGLGGSFPEQLSLNELQLSDAAGVWLTATRITLRWSPLALLDLHVHAENLQAARVYIERAPVSAPGPSTKPSIPHISVAALSVDALVLGPQLAGMPASLSLRGSVELHSLEDARADLRARRIDGDGEYDLRLKFDRSRMDAALQLHEPASGPLENILKLPGLGALSATVRLNGPHSAERVELIMEAGALHGSLQGTVDLVKNTTDVTYALEAPALAPRPGLAWQRVALHGRWQGAFTAPTADGSLEIEKLQLPGGTRIGALNATLQANGGAVAVHAIASGLEIPGPQPQFLQKDPLKIDASIRLDDPTRPAEITAAHRLFSLRARGQTAGKLSAAVELRLPDLAPFAAFAGQDVRGNALFKADVTLADDVTRFKLDGNAALAGGTAAWLGPLGDRAVLQLSGALTDDAVSIDRLRLSGGVMSFLASGIASRVSSVRRAVTPPSRNEGDAIREIRARWELNVSDLTALSTELAGKLQATGQLNGPPTSLLGEAQVASMLSVRGSPSGAVTATVHARGIPTAPTGTLQVRGTLDGAPLIVDIEAQQSGGGLRALIRQAEWKSAHLDGEFDAGTAPPQGKPQTAQTQAHGQLQVKIADLHDLQRLLGLEIQGSLAGNVGFKPVGDRTHIQLKFDAANLAVAQFAGSASLSGEGPTDALHLQLAVQLPDSLGPPASLSSTAILNLDAHSLHMATLVADYRGQAFHLLAPADLLFADGLSISPFKVGAKQAVLEVQGRISPDLDLRASLRQVNPSLVNAFVPQLLSEGTLEADAQLHGSPAAPTGSVRVDATGIRLTSDAALGLPALALHATAKLTGNTATVDGRLATGDMSLLAVSGNVPLNADGALDLKILGKLDVGLGNAMLEARGLHAAGQLDIDATVAGTAAAPQIGGTISLTKGNLRDYVRGVHLSDINAQIVGHDGVLQIKTLTAGARAGSISMTGSVGVLQPGMPVDLQLTARKAQPIESTIVTANLDADLHVSGGARTRIDVAGKVHLNRTTIGIPNALPPDVAVLDVRRRGRHAPPPPEKQLVIGFDVTVQAPQQILVQGRGLDAELGGELHISGTSDAPLVSGGFDLQRGSFSLAGNKLSLTPPGRVSFDGGGLNKLDPTLDFTAQTTVADATATLHISGLADAPKFDFSSVPSLPQDEILARLLFGENAAQLSALQVAQIGAAVATLSGIGGGGLNPLVKLQKSLGLDRLSVGANTTTTATGATENSGANIQAGRYISRRVYVEAKQSTTGSSQVQVDVDLTKHLKLQTRLGNGTAITQGTTPENDPGSSVGLSYQFEY